MAEPTELLGLSPEEAARARVINNLAVLITERAVIPLGPHAAVNTLLALDRMAETGVGLEIGAPVVAYLEPVLERLGFGVVPLEGVGQ